MLIEIHMLKNYQPTNLNRRPVCLAAYREGESPASA